MNRERFPPREVATGPSLHLQQTAFCGLDDVT